MRDESTEPAAPAEIAPVADGRSRRPWVPPAIVDAGVWSQTYKKTYTAESVHPILAPVS